MGECLFGSVCREIRPLGTTAFPRRWLEGRARRRCCRSGRVDTREHDHDSWAIPADPVPVTRTALPRAGGRGRAKTPTFSLRTKSARSPSAAPKRHGVGRVARRARPDIARLVSSGGIERWFLVGIFSGSFCSWRMMRTLALIGLVGNCHASALRCFHTSSSGLRSGE